MAPRLPTRDIIAAANSDAKATGKFVHVGRHEPKSPPAPGLTAATWFQRLRPVPAASGLSETSAVITFTMRLYQNFLAEPQDEIDPNMVDAVDLLFTRWHDNYDFGLHDRNVRNVDVLGQAGTPLSAVAGYINVSGQLNRVIDITLPVIVNDVWPQNRS